ncbi:Peptidyl-prolyl cis-trans isomerase-like 4 [Coemansia sp. RSA 1646]|nr:Peptidyl-prolyl cis-trans isomerase-like 4 [Coemansia sp. RSA 1646]
MSVLLETSVGDLVIDLYTDSAPLTTKNFLKLCKLKYYNFTIVHHVETGFVVQMGDPTGTGQGGESVFGVLGGSKYFPPEMLPSRKHRRGTVSMVVLDDDARGVSGSQFFITLSNGLDYLDNKHAVFGEIAEGWDTLDKMDASICDEGGRPLSDILVRHTIVLHDPFPDPPGFPSIPHSPLLPTAEQEEIMRIEAGDSIEVAEDREMAEKRRREQEAKAQALTLEMIGDLPYADVKPPDTVLFVCKLNAITRDDDLETIFARFGKIVSCEIVRDNGTGDSLGYAFIEFETKEACEEAYFKMDNVLIDDRRIHVDFSQSVSRLNGKWVRTRSGADDLVGDGGGRQGKLQMRRKYRDDVFSGGEDRNMGAQAFDFVFEAPQNTASNTKDSRDRGKRRHDSARSERHYEHNADRDRDRGHTSSQWDSMDRKGRHRHGSGRRSSKSPEGDSKRRSDNSHRRSRFDR